jgi:secreted trypsin-like serine protease
LKKNIFAAAAAILATLAVAGGALAIINGGPDGNGHPEVGALLAQQAFSDGTWEECTGTLIAPRVFLTAAHCDLGVSRVEVTFASAFDRATSTTYWGTWHADPAYNKANSDPHDIAVVMLDKAVRGITPARLPAANSLSGLTGTQQFTSVGYGAQAVTNGPGGKTFHYTDVRFVAVGTLNSLPGNGSWLRVSQNASTGNGGTCYGDSGGPNFLGAGASETRIVAATTISGDTPCRSTNVDYRLDSASARAFLSSYVALP